MPRNLDPLLKNLKVPWLTKEGYIDLAKFPIEDALTQALSSDSNKFRNACVTLGQMALAGKIEAGIFLCGLLRHCGDDLRKKESVADALGHAHTNASADALFLELEHTKSSRSTRVYIDAVLKALQQFPLELVKDRFIDLTSDPKWSYRMRQRFEEVLDRLYRRAAEDADIDRRLALAEDREEPVSEEEADEPEDSNPAP